MKRFFLIKHKKYALVYFLILQIISIRIVAFFPEFIEKYYSNGFYKITSNVLRKILGSIPFSVGDVIYGVVVAFLLYKIIKNRRLITIKTAIVGILNVLSVFYFLFHLFWGMNYYRIGLEEKMNLSYEYSHEQLLNFTDKIIEKSNVLHLQITNNDSLKVVNPYSNKQIYQKTQNAYDLLSVKHPEFVYKNHCVKNSLISIGLSYMGFGGYMNPFTGEAQVNALLPRYTFATTALHEISHQIGYASESEANFIGYLASVNSDDLYFKYSGTVFALRYCLGNIERTNPEITEKYLSKINYGIRLNFEETYLFWETYQNPLEVFFKAFYDSFLKANAQEEGLETYSKFLGLLISYQN